MNVRVFSRQWWVVASNGSKKSLSILTIAGLLLTMGAPAGFAFAAVGFGSVTSGVNSSSPSDSSSITLSKPASASMGDFLLAGITYNGGVETSVTAPSGWTLIERTDGSEPGSSPDTDIGLATYYKFVGASDPGPYTWSVANDDTEPRAAGGILRYTGVHATSPIDVKAESEGHDDIFVAPSVTTTFTNDLVVVFFSQDDDNDHPTPSGTTERFDVENADSSGPRASAADFAQAAIGSTGTKSIDSGESVEDWVTQTIALRGVGDTTDPETTINTGPVSLINSDDATFSFSANETSTFQCKLDDGAYASCTSAKTYNDLEDGEHTLYVFATDTAGNIDETPATWTWTIDTTGPVVTITSPADSGETEQSGIVTFDDGDSSTVTCTLDTVTVSCDLGGSYTFSDLDEGPHTFNVQGADSLGNTGSDSVTWDVVIPVTPTHTLDVVVTGGGSVSSAPAGIACASDCTEDYEVGTAVTLAATPDILSTFSGWGGDCTGTDACVVTMTEDMEVTATFLTVPLTCPPGFIGVFPACFPDIPLTCPPGTTGIFPACVPIESCPPGFTGIFPACVPVIDICDIMPIICEDMDDDDDTILDVVDNCPLIANTDQEDSDDDGIGDVCDDTPDGDFCPLQDGIQTEMVALSLVSSPANTNVATADGADAVLTDLDNDSGNGQQIHSAWTASIPGAQWIWSENPVSQPTTDQFASFFDVFVVTGTNASGTLQIAADNSYEVWLNGTMIHEDATEANYSLAGQDSIPVTLLTGTNTLEVRVKNWASSSSNWTDNPAGVIYKLSYASQTVCVDPAPPPAPGTLIIVKNTVGGNGTFNFTVGATPVNITTIGSVGVSDPISLAAGSTTITENLQEGWTLESVSCEYGFGSDGISTPYGHEVLISSGYTTTCTFTNEMKTTIKGYKWNDLNNNNYWDGIQGDINPVTPEPGLANWIIKAVPELGIEDTRTTKTATTSANGYFKFNFTQGEGGWWVISEEQQSNWNQTFPFNLVEDVKVIRNTYRVNVTPGFGIDMDSNTPLASHYENQNLYFDFGNHFLDLPDCSDGVDNDNDGFTDYPADGDCSDANDDNGGEDGPVNTGGGGGGNPGANGPISTNGPSSGGGQVLGASTFIPVPGEMCSQYIHKFMGYGRDNDAEQVKRLQKILISEGFNVTENGIFDDATLEAVKAFQKKYADDILTPWGITEPTGFVYLTTRKKLNELYCKAVGQEFPLTTEELAIIDRFKSGTGGNGGNGGGGGGSGALLNGNGGAGGTGGSDTGGKGGDDGLLNGNGGNGGAGGDSQVGAAAGSDAGSDEGGFWGKLRGFLGF